MKMDDSCIGGTMSYIFYAWNDIGNGIVFSKQLGCKGRWHNDVKSSHNGKGREENGKMRGESKELTAET